MYVSWTDVLAVYTIDFIIEYNSKELKTSWPHTNTHPSWMTHYSHNLNDNQGKNQSLSHTHTSIETLVNRTTPRIYIFIAILYYNQP